MLREYKEKRDFTNTPEPSGDRNLFREKSAPLRFVIQKHSASRLHYDFRLETADGALMSWAVPKGLSLDPKDKRLAVETEDHPLSYINFEGTIPEGNYGAGTVIVWDTGQYEPLGDEIRKQQATGRVRFILHGQRFKGEYSMIRMKRSADGAKNQWLIVKTADKFAHTNDSDAGSLTGSINTRDSAGRDKSHQRQNAGTRSKGRHSGKPGSRIPSSVRPMLATAIDQPFDSKDWVFEVKWDGVRAVLFYDKDAGVVRLQSRNQREITSRYPELIREVDSSIHCDSSAVLDGEIVVLNDRGVPDFQSHQSRMNLDSERDIERYSRQLPATYFVFDILYLDGRSLQKLGFVQRRKILSKVVQHKSNGHSLIRISDYIEGDGRQLFRNAVEEGLEGLVAKRKQSTYEQGARSSAWLKIKGVLTQDCVVIGYTKGEGNREGLFGSLILAAFDSKLNRFRFVGHSGSGFGTQQLRQALNVMSALRVEACPIGDVPHVNRQAVWLKPRLIAEIKFSGWTREGIMRAPIFLRFRDDKQPRDCTLDSPADLEKVLQDAAESKDDAREISIDSRPANAAQGRAAPYLTNLNKVFFPQAPGAGNPAGLRKKDLIDYYQSVATHILPHLRDRPLSLKRYPDGINGKSFFHKNWNQSRPEFVDSMTVYSDSRGDVINYILCNNVDTLLWLANLGCIEMHPWYSHVSDRSACASHAAAKREGAADDGMLDESKCGLASPDFIVFDLDPYIYSGKERAGQEPEYNKKAYMATVDVALDLKELLDSLHIVSYVKTSGKTGLHIFIPVVRSYTFEQTRRFAEVIGRMLLANGTRGMTMQWNVSERKEKVFFDYNQNARGKTVASVLSVRPTADATVSMPLAWNRLEERLPTDYTILTAPDYLKNYGDPWRDIFDHRQDLYGLLVGTSDVA
ncbi:MAG: non-homologous end-joining DNA ligase [Nitrososphaera sp.]|jgi:bifunctional non-homologous end joining protein LigD